MSRTRKKRKNEAPINSAVIYASVLVKQNCNTKV